MFAAIKGNSLRDSATVGGRCARRPNEKLGGDGRCRRPIEQGDARSPAPCHQSPHTSPSGATHAFSKSPLSCASRPFTGPILNGSRRRAGLQASPWEGPESALSRRSIASAGYAFAALSGAPPCCRRRLSSRAPELTKARIWGGPSSNLLRLPCRDSLTGSTYAIACR
jgi:hypothetical protein